MAKKRKVGEKFRPVVTVIKMKKGEPSVVEISGNRYVLRNENKKTTEEGQQQ